MKKFNILFLLILICGILNFTACSKTKKNMQEFSDLNSQTNTFDLENSNLQNNNSRILNTKVNSKTEDKKKSKRISKLEKELENAEKKANSILDIRIAVTKNSSSVPLSFIMESNRTLSKKIQLNYEIFSSDTEVEKSLLENEIDFAVLPLNFAAKIYNEFENIKIAAVLQNENFYVLTKDKNLNQLSDLAGKKIYVQEENSYADLLIKYLLHKNQIEIGNQETQVNLNYSLPQGEFDYALLCEPEISNFINLNSEIQKSIKLSDEYYNLTEISENFPMYVIVVNSDFVKKNKKLVKRVLKLFENAQTWVLKNPIKASLFVKRRSLLPYEQKILSASIENSAFTYKNITNVRKETEILLNMFLSVNPDSVGQKLPDNNFYLNY